MSRATVTYIICYSDVKAEMKTHGAAIFVEFIVATFWFCERNQVLGNITPIRDSVHKILICPIPRYIQKSYNGIGWCLVVCYIIFVGRFPFQNKDRLLKYMDSNHEDNIVRFRLRKFLFCRTPSLYLNGSCRLYVMIWDNVNCSGLFVVLCVFVCFFFNKQFWYDHKCLHCAKQSIDYKL